MSRVARTRNGGTWTEAQFWGAVRSALRNKFTWWKPMREAKEAARRPYKGAGRQKWEFQCNTCKGWYMAKEVQVDHIVPCGSLKCPEDIEGFLDRMTPESPEAFQVLCKPCHQIKTNAERKKL